MKELEENDPENRLDEFR